MLEELLNRNPEIREWAYILMTDRALETGLEGGKFGGPYSPPSFSERITKDGSRILIKWRDGTVSTGAISTALLIGSESEMARLKESRYEDMFEPDILGAQNMPDIKLYDEDVSAAIEDPSKIYEQIHDIKSEVMGRFGKIDLNRALVARDTRIVTSNGLDYSWQSTTDYLYLNVDYELDDYVVKRRLLGQTDTEPIITRLSNLVPYIKKPANVGSGKMSVRLMPKIADRFVETFIETNLEGEMIADKRSAFSKEDFENKVQKFRPDLTLYADPTIDFDSSSFPCTTEGVPTRRIEYIKDGALITPIMGTRSAKRLGRNPVPDGDLRFDIGYQRFELDDALLIYDVLGLHTCDSSSGNFSVDVAKALLAKNGKIIGMPRISIAGNFFDILKSDDTVFYDLGEDCPAIETDVSVTAH